MIDKDHAYDTIERAISELIDIGASRAGALSFVAVHCVAHLAIIGDDAMLVKLREHLADVIDSALTPSPHEKLHRNSSG